MRRFVPHSFDGADPQFARSMNSYSQGQMFDANAVQTLVNGDEIFPAMLQSSALWMRTDHFSKDLCLSSAGAVSRPRALRRLGPAFAGLPRQPAGPLSC